MDLVKKLNAHQANPIRAQRPKTNIRSMAGMTKGFDLNKGAQPIAKPISWSAHGMRRIMGGPARASDRFNAYVSLIGGHVERVLGLLCRSAT